MNSPAGLASEQRVAQKQGDRPSTIMRFCRRKPRIAIGRSSFSIGRELFLGRLAKQERWS
jgi:hypothetical protein